MQSLVRGKKKEEWTRFMEVFMDIYNKIHSDSISYLFHISNVESVI